MKLAPLLPSTQQAATTTQAFLSLCLSDPVRRLFPLLSPRGYTRDSLLLLRHREQHVRPSARLVLTLLLVLERKLSVPKIKLLGNISGAPPQIGGEDRGEALEETRITTRDPLDMDPVIDGDVGPEAEGGSMRREEGVGLGRELMRNWATSVSSVSSEGKGGDGRGRLLVALAATALLLWQAKEAYPLVKREQRVWTQTLHSS